MQIAGAAGGYVGVLKNISWEDIQKTIFHYATMVARAAGYIDFDIIYAHDWLTFPAAVALKNRFEKPLVCHVLLFRHYRLSDDISLLLPFYIVRH